MALTNAEGKPLYKWVMWIDADAFYTNQTISINDILAKAKPDDYLIIAEDYQGVCANTGIWIIKNNEQGNQFLQLVKKSFPYFKDKRYPEQQAVVDIIFGYLTEKDLANQTVAPYQNRACSKSDIISGVTVLPQRAMNSYYTYYSVDYPNASWHPGDYIAHVAAGGDTRPRLIRRLMSCMAAKGNNLQGCEVNGSWEQ